MTSSATAIPVATAAERRSGSVFIAIHVEAGRLREVVDARPDGWAAALAVAVSNVRWAALGAVRGGGVLAIAATPRRMVREALHALDEDIVGDVRAAALDGHCEAWLRDLANQAMGDREFARAIAASVIASAGERMLRDAMTVTAGPGFSWDLELEEIVERERCGRHDVFCCLACTDETLAPVIALRGRAFSRSRSGVARRRS